MPRPWRPSDLFYLRTHYGRVPVAKIAHELGRTAQAVRGKAHVLGLRNKPPWTVAEKAYLRAHYEEMTCAELGEIVGHTPGAVRQEAVRLGLSHPNRTWSEEEVDALEHDYDGMTARELGKRLGFSEHQVWTKASMLGLRKSEALTAEAESVLWELRDVPGVEEYFSREFGVGLPAVQRALDELRERGGPSRSPGNLPPPEN